MQLVNLRVAMTHKFTSLEINFFERYALIVVLPHMIWLGFGLHRSNVVVPELEESYSLLNLTLGVLGVSAGVITAL